VLERLTSRDGGARGGAREGGWEGGRGGGRDGGREARGERRARGGDEELFTAGQQQREQERQAGGGWRSDARGARRDGDRDRGAPAAPRPSPRPLPSAAAIPIIRDDGKGGEQGSFFSSATWGSLGLLPELIAALRNVGINRPSHVQVRERPARGRWPGGGRARVS
jgi:ATP-dependent RNA helicase DDX18/HAS1